jgi:hypothetical protein
MTSAEDLLSNIVTGNISDLASIFNDGVKEKISDLLDTRREEIASEISTEE